MNSLYMTILKNNMDKINWISLSKNPEAIHLLEANPKKIRWLNFYDWLYYRFISILFKQYCFKPRICDEIKLTFLLL